MKNFLLTVLVASCTVSATAQDYTTAKPKRMKKMIIGLAATPEYLMNVDKAPANENYEYDYTNKFSYGIGLDVWYGLNTDFFITTGVYQSFRKYMRKEICYDCANGFNYESEFRLNYLDIPLGTAYKIVNKRADFIVQGGFVASILEKAMENRNSISGSYYDYQVKYLYNKMLMGFQAGLGTNFNLTYRLSVGLTVNYRTYFTQVTNGIPVKWHGVSTVTGIYYKF